MAKEHNSIIVAQRALVTNVKISLARTWWKSFLGRPL